MIQQENMSYLSVNNISVSAGALQSLALDDIVPVKIINKAKFPILLGHFPTRPADHFAVKLYPFNEDNKNPFFLNEMRFAKLIHKNILCILHSNHEKQAIFKDRIHKVSYIIMELAPFGDFHQLMASNRDLFDDEKLVRTYFHHLIAGLQYLHTKQIAHLDLKLENLLLGDNYILKICDFDQAYIKDQSPIFSKGTECFRAPELAQGACKNSQAADIYSAGIILFVLKCKGVLPYLEKGRYQGFKMFDLMMKDPALFWEKHCEIQNKSDLFFDQSFIELFCVMTSCAPEKRPNVSQIKKSKWYNEPIYSEKELVVLMKSHIKPK